MLHIIGGNGDTLRRRLAEAAGQGGRMIVIVPEQYTLQTERELIDALNAPGFFDLEVLSPSRLTERVLAEAGADDRVRIDARGKQLALARTLLQCRKSLRYYESAAEKQGFIQRIGALIADFKRAGVTPEQLTEYAESMDDGAAHDKFADLALIYARYEAQLAGQFVDGEDVLNDVLQKLPGTGLFRDARAAVFGFDVFTGQMNRLLLALAAESRETLALIVLGEDEGFAPVRESAARLQKAAEDVGIPCDMTLLPPEYPGRHPQLAHLTEQYLHTPGTPWPGPCDRIRLYAAPNPYFEAHFAAQEMVLLHERGIAFGEMAVVLGDEGFTGVLDTVLESYRIPAYVARKLPALRHGAPRLLISALRAVAGNYDADSMLSQLKSGYAPLTENECWQMENYLLAYGVRGRMWRAPFTRGSAEERSELEEPRARLIAPLENLRDALKAAPDAEDSLRAVFEYLRDTGVYETLLREQEQLTAGDLPAQAVQARQVWEAMMQLLSQAHALLSGTRVTAGQLANWLEAGLEACELSSLPPAADAVMCGRVGSLPLGRPRALFFMNMTDGLIGGDATALLSDAEQEAAQRALHAYLALSGDGKDSLARLDVWKALAAPLEYLYLTRSQATQDGGSLRPFSGLSHIRRLFPTLVEEGGVSQRSAARLPLAPGPALDALGAQMREGPLEGTWLEAWKYLSAAPETKDQTRALCAAFSPEPDAPALPREVTHALFMENIMSVSRLESFAVCPYRHFVEQGLSPQPRKEWTLTPIDAGNFYHSALEGFTRMLPGIPAWPKIDRKTCDAAVDKAAGPLFDQLLSGVMGDSARMKALGEKYRRVLKRVAWTFTRGARVSAFSTQNAEVRFGYAGGIPPVELTLSDGSRVFVRGIIDRIDRYEGDEGVYLRVVDYKSGNEKLNAARIFWGAQLQLLLYLQAALSMEEGAAPAGAFYMHVADPLLPDARETADIEDALARALSLRGVMLKDAAILKKMDAEEPPLTLPKTVTANGDFDKRAMLASLEDMKNLIGHAMKTAGQMAERMRKGEIAATPLCSGDGRGPCDTCDYAAICRKDAGRSPQTGRRMAEMKFDELLEKIGGKE